MHTTPLPQVNKLQKPQQKLNQTSHLKYFISCTTFTWILLLKASWKLEVFQPVNSDHLSGLFTFLIFLKLRLAPLNFFNPKSYFASGFSFPFRGLLKVFTLKLKGIKTTRQWQKALTVVQWCSQGWILVALTQYAMPKS